MCTSMTDRDAIGRVNPRSGLCIVYLTLSFPPLTVMLSRGVWRREKPYELTSIYPSSDLCPYNW